ncbi:MAG: type IV pilin protein [Thiohalomonadaceae bacterium]
MNTKSGHGFTLIELMIIVAIIGVLIALTLPAYDEYISTARSGAARQNMEMLAIAEENYFYDNNTYLAGTYDPNGDDDLRGPLGWNPDGDDGQFVYTVSPCAGGTIAVCMTITVTGFDGAAVVSMERIRP